MTQIGYGVEKLQGFLSLAATEYAACSSGSCWTGLFELVTPPQHPGHIPSSGISICCALAQSALQVHRHTVRITQLEQQHSLCLYLLPLYWQLLVCSD
jgi:hypothetical protein